MKRTPEIDAWLRARLKLAVEQFGDGSTDAFGRLLGYANGGSVRQSLKESGKGSRRVQQAILDRSEAVSDLKDWFKLPPELSTHTTNDEQGELTMLSREVREALSGLDGEAAARAENVLRAHLGLDQITVKGGESRHAS